MKLNLKSIASWLLLAFILYAIYKTPAKAGNVANDVIAFGGHAVKSLIVFFDNLLT